MNVSKTAKPRGAAGGATKRATPADAVVGTLIVVDNKDDTVSVFGQDAAGNQVELPDVATITVTSSDGAVLVPSMVNAHTVKLVGLTPGTANALIKVVLKTGTFTITQPVTVGGALATGLYYTVGTPTVS